MSNFNQELLDEINFVRANPRRYAKKLYKYMEYFNDKILRIPGRNAGIATEEGAQAFKEAAEFLLNEQRREPLTPSKGLCQVSSKLVEEAQKDADNVANINIENLIKQVGSVKGSLSRIFEFGGDTPELVIINLVVSDGDPSRGQRQSLLNPAVKKIGIANGIHNMYGHCTVLISATEFKSNDGGEDNRFLDGEYVPNLEINNDNEIEEGVIKITKTESYITENGKKKKITKIIKHMENGTKQIETIKENAD